ncbi:hypothetical protein EYZ11_002272 [Aspergillus tanneri]|uniref:Mannan endo-1,6-alpha-mannosidase n=1 Tax=Aspergillus tanneri TaxID=1220188 RepID=A0A4S3JS10_9EURO|nr:uncharacterized protein ATNIH1004_001918 [Aspergillus tanneri]KAA8641453.1 hypothetical protein ATNIH1004_001918 [Aspergillus tanneri]THC98270.1 hypothetical protein EYZ11_002272 [Aspergillus tanneri]
MSPIPLSFILVLYVLGTAAQNPKSRAEIALGVLQTWYNGTSGIWDTCGWWNGANCMTVLTDLAMLDESVDQATRGVLENTFAVAPRSNPIPDRGRSTYYANSNDAPSIAVKATPWLDGSYDDDAWWALAWIAAYDLTDNGNYLDLAVGIFDNLNQTGPSKCGQGGIYWDYNHAYVNAISNELFLSVAAHLANRVSGGDQYRDLAQRQWQWFRDSGMINDNSTINDGLTDACANNGGTIWSYNQGVVLGALVELHQATSDSSYLDSAAEIAKAAIDVLADENNVIRESCEPDSCDANATQFKGIFVRNLGQLHSVAPDDKYEKVITASANSIWANDRNDANQLGVNWAGPIGKVDASTHSSAMDALVAAIE